MFLNLHLLRISDMVLWKISGAGTCAEWKAVETVAAKRNYKSSEQF